MTASTPVYGIKYIAVGEPIRNTRQALQDNAETIEAALVAGGIAPPGAADLAALSGRVSVLETPTLVNLPTATGFSSLAVAGWATAQLWRAGKRRGLQGTLVSAAALTANTAYTVANLVTGDRPAGTQKLTVSCYTGSAETTANLLVWNDGRAQVVPAVAMAAGATVALSGEWWAGL